ncbi:hypothetical protein ASF61_21770 [Duganella sp. Leaf126]|uniref:hypothetical protein n=1 Tax=Duganella sp. Leaf126 TaxID=1736266 RepID=UPI0006F9D9F0|nr:hypothetical protein [Duganella sp. Leaf126]KQQ44369.1 hypothetical protein ASF61_21770 [Duganella sp. Leaf126]
MRPWLTRTLVVVATVGACWMGAIWYWRETRRMPATEDLVVYLVLLPLLLLALLALAVWAGRKLSAAGAAKAAAAAAAAAAGAAAAHAGDGAGAAPASTATLTVLAGALRMPHGDSAAQLADAMLARKVTLSLDPVLVNDNGYPILSGRIDDLDAGGQEQAMTDWLATHHPEAVYTEEHWRALALGSDIAAQLTMELAAHPLLPDFIDAQAAGKPLPPLPALQLLALLPEEWGVTERRAGADWLRQVVVHSGWPEARTATSALAAAGQPAPGLYAQLAQRVSHGQHAGNVGAAAGGELCLVVACHSRLGADSIQAWSDQFILFDSDHPQGRIPGEGAAGLLLGDHAQATLLAIDAPVLLHAASHATRQASADGKARGDNDLLAQLATQALQGAGVPASAVAALVADSDQRTGRITELLGMATAVVPELDAASEVLSVTAACGDAGAVATVAALVLAAQQVGAGAGPALCVTNLDPFQRGAVVLASAAPPLAMADAAADTAAVANSPA